MVRAELDSSVVAEIAEQATGQAPQRIEPMPGGASTRAFYRVHWAKGDSAVAMHVPAAGQSEEIAKSDRSAGRWPFLQVRDLLHERGIEVPHVLAEACHRGFLLVEDLGDFTLANYLLEFPESRTQLYQQAVRDLARAQGVLRELPPGCIIGQRRFDRDLLRWEVEHFREWALDARGMGLDEAGLAIFHAAADYLAETISGWDYSFVHRDYQSRNLMVRPAADGTLRLVWIDFQDALLGPRAYDLVALLGDSYQVFEPAFIQARLDEYAAAIGVDADEGRRIRYEFDIVTVQRKLKDAGRFVFIDRTKGNPSFLEYVEPTIRKARTALGRLQGEAPLAALAELLDRTLGLDAAG